MSAGLPSCLESQESHRAECCSTCSIAAWDECGFSAPKRTREKRGQTQSCSARLLLRGEGAASSLHRNVLGKRLGKNMRKD